MIKEHESYGILSISKVQGTPVRFFGSELKPTNFICLEIKEAKLIDSKLQSNEISSGETIVRIRMTNAQFAEAITSLNFGIGTPCTIERANGKSMENPPKQISKIEETSQKYQLESTESIFNEYIDELVDIINKKGSAKQKETAERIKSSLKKRLSKDFEFSRAMLKEAKEQAIAEIKAETEAIVTGIVTQVGIDSIKSQQKLLSSKEQADD